MDVSTSELSLTREELYKRVWSTPMQKLACEFGMSDVGLAKICKKHKIPRPSRGYWARLENGKQVLRWPLPSIKDKSLATIHIRRSPEPPVTTPQVQLATDPEIAKLIAEEFQAENRIECVTDLRHADPLVIATRDSLAKMEPDEYGRVSRRYDFPNASFDVAVSKSNVQRALLLLQSLVKALKARGYSLVAGTDRHKNVSVRVLECEFQISVWEPAKRIKREPTKQEKLDAERWRWSRLRDYEHVPSGNLELHLDRSSYSSTCKITDTQKARIEDRLNEFVVDMLRAVDRHRQQIERQRLEAIEKEKRRQHALEQEVIRRTESVREARLLKAVPRWQKSAQIREYIDAVRQEAMQRSGQIDDDSELGRWLRWAECYVERLDPLSQRHQLPTFSLTDQELEQLRQECQADWEPYSEAFRPRQPR